MASETGSEGSGEDSEFTVADGPVVEATLAIEPHDGADCAVVEGEEDVDVRDQNLTFVDFSNSKSAKCHTTVADGEDKTGNYIQTEIDSHCFCPMFHEVDCVPRTERVQGNEIIVSVLVPNRKTLRRLIKRIRATGATVSVYGITQPDAETDESVVMDITDMTEKQREALEAAIEAGYYETPRQADLATLSERLGISKSAVSQRLKAVESKLVHRLAEQCSG